MERIASGKNRREPTQKRQEYGTKEKSVQHQEVRN
jgi:hypothetical protein